MAHFTVIISWLLKFYLLATSKVISRWVLMVVTVCTHGDFIVLPHLKTRLPVQ